MRFAFILIANLALITALNAAESVEGPENTPILLESNKTFCRMYQEFALTVAVEESIEFKLEHVISSDTNLVNVVAIENLNCSSPEVQRSPCPVDGANATYDNYQFYSIVLDPLLIGQVNVTFFPNATSSVDMVVVIREPLRFVDKFFKVFVWTMGVLFSGLLGVLLETSQLKALVEKPLAPVLGFSIQYCCMPLLAFMFVNLFEFGSVEALAIFLYGCCPGGSASNNWTILFDGDINLSAVMTFASNIGSLVMLPLWVYTLGRGLMLNAQIEIPFHLLIAQLMIVVVPCLIGFGLTFKFPGLRARVLKIAKPFTLIFVTCFLTFVFYTKWYTFQLMKWYYFLGAPMVPWTGYAVAMTIASLSGLPWKQVKTVSIETGIQNVGIAFIIIMANFPSPQAEFAYLPLTAVALFTGIPLYIIYLITKFHKYVVNRSKGDEAQEQPEHDAYESLPVKNPSTLTGDVEEPQK